MLVNRVLDTTADPNTADANSDWIKRADGGRGFRREQKAFEEFQAELKRKEEEQGK